MKKNIKTIILGIFIFSVLSVNTFAASLQINDIEALESYERRVINRLTNQRSFTPPEDRVLLHITLYGGPGIIGPLGSSYRAAFSKIGINFTIGAYFNISSQRTKFWQNFFIALEMDFVYMGANSIIDYLEGTNSYTISTPDGKLIMVPFFLGVLYEFKIVKKLFISPIILFGLSFNKLTLPTRNYSGQSLLLAFKYGINVRYQFVKKFSLEGSLGMMTLLEGQDDGSTKKPTFMYFSVYARYSF